ncbi:homogentisate 1,2-dioxygenase [Pseudonocardia ammonioxydans]|uniref:Homogentisate 1,2-dioxygenase n=1 Tax=Pseudonocardia ammonioxydans TaxID=260086 RepID=A0A1I5HPC3_PSUAM|nr:homogentisate 1,2-dioxygenase [Pseudonocardia ammonioxydans]SFO50127.1 homogentisate 1,2-dioxygenase [Pseudonocardia ammonioxydans]
MSSNVRRGVIPRSPTGISEHVDEIYTQQGFFGQWVHMFRSRNVGFPATWSSDDVMYNGVDTNELTPADLTDPEGSSTPLLYGDGIAISFSRRAQPMPFTEVNADFHQIRFYHRGEHLLETELGRLEVEAGDFVVVPKGLAYRDSPRRTEGNAVLIFETLEPVVPAEELWDGVGFTSFFTDFSAMKLPEPVGQIDNVETEVRLKFRGEVHRLTYDFDPCSDVVGWMGDPVMFSLNVWDIPGLGSSHGFLPPPAAAVLMSQDKSFFFNVMSPKPWPSAPEPNGSIGAPAHLNDYDEVWFNHVADAAPHTDGHLWRLPPSIPHPGIKRPPFTPDGPVERPQELKLNFDCRSTLTWTEAGRKALMPDPQIGLYTSLAGTHIGVVPDEAVGYAAGRSHS